MPTAPTDLSMEISSMLHDLRNPVATIRLGAEMLIRANPADPALSRIAPNLRAASVRVDEMLKDYIDKTPSFHCGKKHGSPPDHVPRGGNGGGPRRMANGADRSGRARAPRSLGGR